MSDSSGGGDGPAPRRGALAGIIAQAVGMVAAALWLNAYSPYVSPLSSRVAGSYFSVFMGLLFGGVTYWLLARKSVRADGEATPAFQGAPSAAA